MRTCAKRRRPAPGDVGDDARGHRLVEHVEQLVLRRRRRGERARRARTRARAPRRAPAARLQSSERWVSRRAMTSRTLWGIAADAWPPSAASRRTISPTKSGLPSVSSCSARRARPPELGRGQLDVLARRSASLRPASASRRVTGSRADLGQHRGERLPGNRVDVAVGAEQTAAGRRRARARGTAGAAATACRPRAGRRARARSARLARRCAGTPRSRRTAESAPPRVELRGSGRSGKRSRSSGTSWASSAAPAPSCARRAAASVSRT